MTKKIDKQIEIELRAIFDKRKYAQLKSFLDKNAQDLGEDDKDVWFFILADKLFKVVNNVSQKSAKLVLKLSKIGRGSDFEEVEIPIQQQEVKKAVKMFTALGITDNIMHSLQKRHNYLYRGVELALKYSEVWGYHLELEIVINNQEKKKEAEEQIRKVAAELGIKLMTDEELSTFTKKVEEKYRREEQFVLKNI